MVEQLVLKVKVLERKNSKQSRKPNWRSGTIDMANHKTPEEVYVRIVKIKGSE